MKAAFVVLALVLASPQAQALLGGGPPRLLDQPLRADFAPPAPDWATDGSGGDYPLLRMAGVGMLIAGIGLMVTAAFVLKYGLEHENFGLAFGGYLPTFVIGILMVVTGAVAIGGKVGPCLRPFVDARPPTRPDAPPQGPAARPDVPLVALRF